jgi:hypothetical protein
MVSTQVFAQNGLQIPGFDNCGTWIERRTGNDVRWRQMSERGVVSGLSGMSLAYRPIMNFWNSEKGNLSPSQFFLWMDNYCRKNPLKSVIPGMMELFLQHSTLLK